MTVVNKPRIVIDTNLFISAILIAKSPPGQLLALWKHDSYELLTSNELVDELCDVSSREKFQIAYPGFSENASELINTLKLSATIVTPLPERDLPIHCRDPKDDVLLSCTFGGKATHLITGDLDLLSLKDEANMQHLAIITVTEFLSLFSS